MKKILLTAIMSAVLLPSMAFASEETPSGSEKMVDDVISSQEDEMGHRPPKGMKEGEHKGKGHKKDGKKGKGKKPDFENMTAEEKEAFFQKRIEGIERHHKKMSEDLSKLKTMTTAEKEAFFKEKKSKMKKDRDQFNKACKRLEKDGFKSFSPAEAREKMMNSRHYKEANADQKAKMEARLAKFEAMPEEKRGEILENRKSELQSMCDKQKQY